MLPEDANKPVVDETKVCLVDEDVMLFGGEVVAKGTKVVWMPEQDTDTLRHYKVIDGLHAGTEFDTPIEGVGTVII